MSWKITDGFPSRFQEVPAKVRERRGKYELVTLMSVGGMAELYLASMAGPGGFRKAVALKQVLPELRGDPQFVGRFLDEARITAALTHPHIGQVFDLGEAEGELYLAMGRSPTRSCKPSAFAHAGRSPRETRCWPWRSSAGA